VKQRINPAIRAHLIRGAFYLVLLLAVCTTPFALAQRGTSANTAHVPAASSDSGPGTVALRIPEFPTGFPLWDQYNNPAAEPPIDIGSQDFESAFDALDDQAADDFVLTSPPPGINIFITGVRVMGEYSDGGGPASSFNVYLYSNGPGNLPGTLIAAFLNLPYTATPPDFTITLPDPFFIEAGTYWISVQAGQDFNPNGQWFWHNRTIQSSDGAAWENPGDGYGTGCITWNRKNACMLDQVSPDQVFQILGFEEGNPPTPTPTPCSVSTAGCGGIVTTPPTDFSLNVSESVDPATVDASDFTVNGIPADSATMINGNMTIDFIFNSSPAVPNFNTMHIAAGAFNCEGGPVAEFTCTFRYQLPRPTPTPRPRPTPAPRPGSPR